MLKILLLYKREILGKPREQARAAKMFNCKTNVSVGSNTDSTFYQFQRLNINITLLYIIIAIMLSSCNYSFDVTDIPYEPKVVVEGRIDNEKYASVILTRSAPVTGRQDTISILKSAIRSALITVSDGNILDTLRLTRDDDRFPPYVYKGQKIKGETGKIYELKIYHNSQIISSVTHIPDPVVPDSIWFIKNEVVDSIGYLGIRFKNHSDECYQVSTAAIGKTVFNPCLYGNINSKDHEKDASIKMQLSKGPVVFPKIDLTTYYFINNTVKIRFAIQTLEAYQFWCDYQNEVLNSTNPIFPAFTSLRGNIENGIGIWSGYNTVEYQINFKKKDIKSIQ